MATQGRKRSLPCSESDSDVDSDDLFQTDDDEVGNILKCNDPDLDLEKLLLSDEENEDVDDTDHLSTCLDRGLDLRPYQKELAEMAIKGQNTIIYAATGAGKTRVAFYIVKKHLERCMSDGENRKVAILAEKTFLVNQHYLALKKFLPDLQRRTLCLNGQTEKSGNLHLLLDDHDVVIVTPALIENIIKSHDSAFLTKFSLLIFDECHHTKKKSCYSRLMINYHMKKDEGEKHLPQIVGLTATLGTNKANSLEKAKEHIMTIMAMLDVSKISSVRIHVEDYKRFRNDIKEERITLSEDVDNDPVHKSITHSMEKTEEYIEGIPGQLGDQVDERALSATLKNRTWSKRNDPSYITWTSSLTSKAQALLQKKPEIAKTVITTATYLKMYSEVLDINDQLRAKYAVKALKMKMKENNIGFNSGNNESIEEGLFTIVKDLMADISTDSKNIGSTSRKSIDILLEQLKTMNDSRFIIFVKTRELSIMLSELLCDEGYKCSSFTGSNNSADAGGTSRCDQQKVLKDFQNGTITGLVATTILEEGLDIPDCNCQINYGYVGNEISTRQAAGRIRSNYGVRMVISKPRDTSRDKLNVKRGLLMDNAMKTIIELSEDDILESNRRHHQHVLLKQKQQMHSQTKFLKVENAMYKLICSKCGTFEVQCSTLRMIKGTHLVVIDPDIWQKVSLKPFPKQPPEFDGIICHKQLFGKDGSHCSHKLGTVLKYQGAILPSLSHKCVVVTNKETKVSKPLKKWSDAPFKIEDIREPDDYDIMIPKDNLPK